VTKHKTSAGGGTLAKTQSTATVKTVIEGLEPGAPYRIRAVVKDSGIELDAQVSPIEKANWWRAGASSSHLARQRAAASLVRSRILRGGGLWM
jgi:hypothetical protein